MAPKRLELLYLSPAEIIPYDKNPRDNRAAVKAVAESMKTFGFRIPMVLDANNVIVTGHTRFEAAKLLGITDIPVTYADDLTEAQIQAFRLVDNKTSELASWDPDLLAGEIAALEESGIDLTAYGWASDELDCLREMVNGEDISQMTGPNDLMGDGVNQAALHQGLGIGHITNDAKSARITIGEFNFFMDIADYRAWSEQTRKTCNYDKQAIVYYLADKLGMLDMVKDYDRKAVAKANAGTEETLKAHRDFAEADMREKAEAAKARETKRKEQLVEQEALRKTRDDERAAKKAKAIADAAELEAQKTAERAAKAEERAAKQAEHDKAKADAKAAKQAKVEGKPAADPAPAAAPAPAADPAAAPVAVVAQRMKPRNAVPA